MKELLVPNTNHPHESEWDRHGASKWSYFSEEAKKRISFFLFRKLGGRNLDVGGGWYLHYPNSVVVDVSSVCLEHNPALDKLQFDLEKLSVGQTLPYPDNTFSSATFISTWQYFHHPEDILGELERLIIPGGEIHIIDGRGALDRCKVRSGCPDEIQSICEGLGYDTVIETIPFGRDTKTFKSVCVAMPEEDLFGDFWSQVWNKKTRIERDSELCEEPLIFEQAYAVHEVRKSIKLLRQLESFPVTQYFVDLQEKIEQFSQEFFQTVGNVPFIFSEHSLEPELTLLTSDDQYYPSGFFLFGEQALDEVANEIINRYDLGFAHYIGYLRSNSIDGFLGNCNNFRLVKDPYWSCGNKTEFDQFARFLGSIPLNSFTRDLQEQMYGALRINNPEIDSAIYDQKSLTFKLATNPYRQNRKLTELLERKRLIQEQGIQIVGERELDFKPYLPGLVKSMMLC
jgi:hypothetical protein